MRYATEGGSLSDIGTSASFNVSVAHATGYRWSREESIMSLIRWLREASVSTLAKNSVFPTYFLGIRWKFFGVYPSSDESEGPMARVQYNDDTCLRSLFFEASFL